MINGDFQDRVWEWLVACLGRKIADSIPHRNHRFLEEALELVQSLGLQKHEVIRLVDYVYSRPAGELRQETGGVMTTLAALCKANGIDMMQMGEDELKRMWVRMETIRAKQVEKPQIVDGVLEESQ